MRAYLREYVTLFAGNASRNPEAEAGVVNEINAAEIVLFVKPSCPYCEAAEDMLSREQKLNTDMALPIIREAADENTRNALRSVLQKPDLTWPAIWIKVMASATAEAAALPAL